MIIMKSSWKLAVQTGRMNTGAQDLVYLVDEDESDLIEKIKGAVPSDFENETRVHRVNYGGRYDVFVPEKMEKPKHAQYVSFVNGVFSFAPIDDEDCWKRYLNEKKIYLRPAVKRNKRIW